MTVEFTDEQRKYYRERLAHYLRSYRERHNLNQQETADKIGYALNHYKRLEAGVEERIANAIEFLTNFASLDFESVVDFLVYLENKAKPAENRKLYPWEESLLKGFNELPLEVRREFTAAYCGEAKKGPWGLVEAIELLKSMEKLEEEDRELIEKLIFRLRISH